MMNLDSHITLAVIFSFIAMVGNGFSIYAIVHTRNKEGQEKEVEMTKNFTRLEVKMDAQKTSTENIGRTVEKMDNKQEELINRVTRQDEAVKNLTLDMADVKARLAKGGL